MLPSSVWPTAIQNVADVQLTPAKMLPLTTGGPIGG